MKWKQLFLSISAAALLVISGCQDAGTGQGSNAPEDIISKVLESQKKVGSYYSEGMMQVYNKNVLSEELSTSFKEWYDSSSGKRRVEYKNKDKEVTAFIEGQQVIFYDKTNHSAISTKFNSEEQLASVSLRDQFADKLKKLQLTHKYQVIGEEQVNGMNSYHVKLTPNKPDTKLGDQEYWVDSKTWFVLKNSSYAGDFKVETEITTLDFSPKLTEDIFTVDIPEDIEIKKIDSLNPFTEVSLAEAEEGLGQPFLVFNGQQCKVTSTKLFQVKGDINRSSVMIQVSKDDVPSYSLEIFKTPVDSDNVTLGQETQVRQAKGWYKSDSHTLTWDEGGLRYSLMNTNPEISLDEMLKSVQNMQLSSK